MNKENFHPHDDHLTMFFPCVCADWHGVLLDWDIEGPDWRMLTVVETYRARRWRDRVVAAWRLLRGKDYHSVDVILSEEAVNDLRAVLAL